MRVHREIKREAGCLTLRAIFDAGYVLRAFRVGLGGRIGGTIFVFGKNWSERQDLSFDQLTTEFAALFEPRQVSCVLPLCTQNKSMYR
jgi:hypothetical protein